jgi:hypothetical protein
LILKNKKSKPEKILTKRSSLFNPHRQEQQEKSFYEMEQRIFRQHKNVLIEGSSEKVNLAFF